MTELLNTTLHFAIGIFCLNGVLLWMHRHRNKRSRQCLAIPFFLVGMAFLLRLFASFAGLTPSLEVLPIANLYGGLIVLLVLYLYPVEVISPGWLTLRRGMILFAPLWLLSLLLLSIPFHFRELSSFGELIKHISEFNVWFRLLILLVCIVPYSFLLFYIPYNWKRSSANYTWISTYTIGIQGIGVLFTLFMLTGSETVSTLHITYCSLFCLCVTYRELFLRIEVPVEQMVEANAAPAAAMPEKTAVAEKSAVPSKPTGSEDEQSRLLWTQLQEALDDGQLWQNPNLTPDELAALLGTDRALLSSLLRQHGYESFKDFINRRRIDAFLRQAREGRITNIQDTFFKEGFRSRTTALRYFKEYTGTTPTEYLHRNAASEAPLPSEVPSPFKATIAHHPLLHRLNKLMTEEESEYIRFVITDSLQSSE